MTPELPRAPRSMAEAARLATSPAGAASSSASMASAAAPMVMDILVPVSPSGTGKMFSSLICFLYLEMLLEPDRMAFFNWEPKIMGNTSFTR